MAIDNSNIIDLIGIDKNSGDVVLTITDHLGWEDIDVHLQLIQNKINNYLTFVESGEIYESYPQAKARKVLIELVTKSKHPPESEYFFSQANSIIEQAGVKFKVSLFEGVEE